MFAATAFSSYGGFWLGYGIYGVLASGEFAQCLLHELALGQMRI